MRDEDREMKTDINFPLTATLHSVKVEVFLPLNPFISTKTWNADEPKYYIIISQGEKKIQKVRITLNH